MNFIKKNFQKKIKCKNGIYYKSIDLNKTREVADFYNKNPFPNFDDFQNKRDLLKIIDKNEFLKDLKEYIGYNKKFIEVGSGTSQLSLALASGTNNMIVALDPTLESLKLGKDFADNNNIENVIFLNADLFDDPCKNNYFDFVWCSGVLHHTIDSKKGFEIISKWVKPGGTIIIGLYNKYGRLRTNLRQLIFKFFLKSKVGENIVRFMDPYLRKGLSKEKDIAWFKDQYEHPLERKHTMDEVINWFENNKIDYLGSIPTTKCDNKLIKIKHMDGKKGSYIERLFSQINMLFSNLGGEGGLFIVLGKKKY